MSASPRPAQAQRACGSREGTAPPPARYGLGAAAQGPLVVLEFCSPGMRVGLGGVVGPQCHVEPPPSRAGHADSARCEPTYVPAGGGHAPTGHSAPRSRTHTCCTGRYAPVRTRPLPALACTAPTLALLCVFSPDLVTTPRWPILGRCVRGGASLHGPAARVRTSPRTSLRWAAAP
eukprot:5483452-Prymnesium_polylepis.1